MFLGLPDPHSDPLVKDMDPSPDPALNPERIFLSSSKNGKKNIDSYCFETYSVFCVLLFFFIFFSFAIQLFISS
jgi:hypothetical protein